MPESAMPEEDEPPATPAPDERPPPPNGDQRPGPPPGSGPHLRFGLGLDLAALGSTDIFGLGVGVQARMGLQLNPWLALYYQPHAIGGFAVTGSNSAAAIGVVYNSVNVELDLPVLQLGIGPSLDVVGLAGCSLGAVACGTGSGTFLGADLRAALMLGPHGPGVHSGFELEANLHPTFLAGDTLTSFTVGFGGEWY